MVSKSRTKSEKVSKTIAAPPGAASRFEDLIAGCAQRGASSLLELYQFFSAKLRLFVLNIVKNENSANNAVDQTSVYVWDNAKDILDSGPIDGNLIFRIGRDKAIEQIKSSGIQYDTTEFGNSYLDILQFIYMDVNGEQFQKIKDDIELILDSYGIPADQRGLIFEFMAKSGAIASTSAAPKSAPVLWQDRQPDHPTNPSKFIKNTYSQWIDNGMTRADLKRLDPALYQAYAQWIRPGRHPEDEIAGLRKRSDIVTEKLKTHGSDHISDMERLAAAQRMRALRLQIFCSNTIDMT